MCFQGRSRFCLICLLLYTWLPQGIHETVAKEIETTTYSTVKKPLEAEGTDDHEVYQLQEAMPEVFEKEYYLDKLMEENGNGSVMTFEGFEHLLHKLGLGKIRVFDHTVRCHKTKNGSDFQSFHITHNHSHVISGSGATNYLCEDVEDVDTHQDDHDNDHGDEHTGKEEGDELSEEHHNHEDQENHNHENVEHVDNERKVDSKLPSNESVQLTNKTIVPEESLQKASEDGTEKHSFDLKRDIPNTDKCLPATAFLYISRSQDLQYLSKAKFQELCPSLIYQISHDTCHDHHIDYPHSHSKGQVRGLDPDHHDDDLDHDHNQPSVVKGAISRVPAKVWGFSTVAVVIISLVGLLGVVVIPIMQKVFYNHLLQFLVALAVGALSGDALLHLLPHAITGGHGSGEHGHGDEEEGGHVDAVYKGLCGLIGIYFFYLIERILTIFTEMKRQKKQSRKRKIVGDDHLDKVGEKLAANCDEMMMSVHPNKALRGYADEAHSEHCTISFENSTSISHQHGAHKHKHSHHEEEEEEEEQVDMLSRSNSHGHGHSHCIDGSPDSIAAIAWMVILGDGIHNLSDGLAIGAAFANSITGGFSTSIAVFCHELPHEIGDFAVLLRAGMDPKKAIIYNCLSSLLCFIGMLIGVAIGNIENASLWIFAVVGGMFLYIALVDMLPEMSSVETKQGENPFCHLILQLLGMLIGGGIMLVIALYEDRLKTIFD